MPCVRGLKRQRTAVSSAAATEAAVTAVANTAAASAVRQDSDFSRSYRGQEATSSGRTLGEYKAECDTLFRVLPTSLKLLCNIAELAFKAAGEYGSQSVLSVQAACKHALAD